MAGIGDMAGGSPGAQAGPAQPKGGDPTEAEDESNVTPEEQAEYDAFMQNALEVIYPRGEDAQVAPNVLKGLSATPDKPLLALATTTVSMVIALRDSAEKAGSPISDDVLFHAGADLVAELAEVAEAAKIHEFSEEEIENAFYMALDLYRGEAEQSGKINRDEAAQAWNQVVDADRNGTLEQAIPGIGERLRGAK